MVQELGMAKILINPPKSEWLESLTRDKPSPEFFNYTKTYTKSLTSQRRARQNAADSKVSFHSILLRGKELQFTECFQISKVLFYIILYVKSE